MTDLEIWVEKQKIYELCARYTLTLDRYSSFEGPTEQQQTPSITDCAVIVFYLPDRSRTQSLKSYPPVVFEPPFFA